MAAEAPATPSSQQPAETGEGAHNNTPAPATQPQVDDGATKDDETVTMSKEDYKNLISSRDRANNSARETEAWVNEQRVRQAIGSFLEENKNDYPDVTVDDLISVAESPEELPELAKAHQTRISSAVQKKLLEVQNTQPPELSPKEKRQKLADLKKSDDPKRFEKMLEVNGVDRV